MTTHLQNVSNSTQWTECTWSEVTDHVAASFRLTSDERDELRDATIPKLIAAIPFLAECDQPMRTALANLSTYMVSVGPAKRVFEATADDDLDVFERLRLAQHHGGDRRIVERGMALIALNMIADYRRDTVLDIAHGKHNPLADGTWRYEDAERELLEMIESVECPQMDSIADVHQIVNGTWAWRSWPSWF